ncbi:nucleotidyl transferase AbiEii/AbiGii toxin family protein [Hippea jasoniae]|uniref:nucleotidyl transferase AbiEii/AbiGii toxin family protein n=1 Tax=Hippea jasoniae TaxID=944479 RepID=UPI000A022242|nr:nucleotidyl transferase AbiEii/AbiGii toxin family protein [Hippea jasoniae]
MKKDLKFHCLSKNTENVLKKLINYDYMSNFVLVGGSALTLRLCHRISEDLDFFTFHKENFNINKLREILTPFSEKEIVNISDEQIDIFLDGVKVTFFNAGWNFLKPKEISNFNVASLKDIAVMKINTLFLRAKYRDYYDLYFLSQYFTLNELYEFSRNILQGINKKLFIAALLFIDDIDDEDIEYLKPAKKVSLKDIRKHFETKIKKEFHL